MTARLAVLAVSVGVCVGCVKAPDIVLTDQKTALEQQAAGEFRALENDLHQANIAPRGEDITSEALEQHNPEQGESTFGEIAQLYSEVETDEQRIDRLLIAGCVGEAVGGLLLHTPEQCKREVDSGQLTRIVERVNLHRRQLWQVISERKPDASAEQVRAAWRKVHLLRVVCGGLIQNDDKSWEPKQC